MNGLYLIKPTSIASTGTGATISTDGSVSFSAVSSLSLNGIFSADYDNYLLVMRSVPSAVDNYYIRYRTSEIDNSTASSYTTQYVAANSGLAEASRAINNYGILYYTDSANVPINGVAVFIYGPYLAQPTAWRTIDASGYGGAYFSDVAGTHNQSTPYDGFTLYRAGASSSITGRVAVYGMVK